jgi:hypothetical protein
VTTLKFWASPAVLIALWIIAAAFTVSQLATVAPLLLSTSMQGSLVDRSREISA